MYILSITFTRVVSKLINIFNLGSGHTWPGHIVLKIYPKVIESIKSRLPGKVVFISGTNGKTTTAKLIRHIAEKHNMSVLHNDTGANLLNGIVSSVLLNSDLMGNLNYDIAVFELDELTLPKVSEEIVPDILALLNLSRDQLDRHWEVDVVADKWVETVERLPGEAVLILDKGQGSFKRIEEKHKGEVLFFSDNTENLSHTNLVGSFNAKNVNCALLIAEKFGISRDEARESLKDFEYAYGRGEELSYKKKDWQIFLAKNPESLNQNLKLLLEGSIPYDSLLYILNDNIPDGLDVSWIYDVDPRLIRKASEQKEVYVAGVRALDMAVRLQYAGAKVKKEAVQGDLKEAIRKVVSNDKAKKIVILPNYSAMLEFRKIVLGKSIL